MSEIPFLDLKAQYHLIRAEVDEAIARVLERGAFILSDEVTAFEEEFAEYCGVEQAVGVSSGTAALQLALLACGVGPGDEVITVSFTSVATVAAIEASGARPVLVDIDPVRYTLDPERFAAAITPRTRAAIPVHLYGCPADMASILEIAWKAHLFVIEDCAQAHGASFRGKKVGGWGDISVFSFYPTKNLGAYGDGGAVVTNNPALAERVRLLRQYGWETRQVSNIRGLNSRLDDLQAAILRVKLKHLESWNARRRELAEDYTALLSGHMTGLPVQPADTAHVYHHYVIRHPSRDDLQAFLAERAIRSLIHYPVPVHLQPAYQDLGYRPGDLPNSELAARQVLSLPLYPEMANNAVETVCREIRNFWGK